MQYKRLGKTDLAVSVLGFGAMRLPAKQGHIDRERAVALLRRAYELGINYFDSAHIYNAGESEEALGAAVKGFRDKAVISTKVPVRDKADRWRADFEECLRRLDTDHVELGLIHSLNLNAYREHVDVPGGILEAALAAKDEGLLKHLSFSSHDTPENIIELLNTGHFATVTMQYNLLDRANEPVIDHAAGMGVGVIIMGPVAGGRLAGYSPEILKMLPGRVKSNAEMALRFVLSNPNVTTALSGMNTMEMIEENAATAAGTEPMSAEERQRVEEILEENRRLTDLYCTGCGYCMPCPEGVNIPRIFELANLVRLYSLDAHARSRYARLEKKESDASACVECGACEKKCPQKIRIMAQLKEAHKMLTGGR